jgi:uncharacterized protein YlxW (UPF0749 family)
MTNDELQAKLIELTNEVADLKNRVCELERRVDNQDETERKRAQNYYE